MICLLRRVLKEFKFLQKILYVRYLQAQCKEHQQFHWAAKMIEKISLYDLIQKHILYLVHFFNLFACYVIIKAIQFVLYSQAINQSETHKIWFDGNY